MTDARKAILADIRRALRRDGPVDDGLAASLLARLDGRPQHPRPAFGGDLVERFLEKLESVHGTVKRVRASQEIIPAIGEYLNEHGLPGKLVCARDGLLEDLRWPDHLNVEHRRAERDDRISVSTALSAVAETGTLVLRSAGTAPTSLNFLPDDHIVVLRAADLVRHQEDAWERLRGEDSWPRTVNLITGPSKTADVEQTIQYGAHGPRRLHVILVEDEP